MKGSLLHQIALTPPLTPPPTPSCAEASAMSCSARLAHARSVRRWLNSLYLDSDRDRVIRAAIEDHIDDNAESFVGTRDPVLLTGDYVLGKSTLL